ncbi:DUF6758 family protein [Nocardioides sp.]|uniref:DUF6758 family protein n=1 Tax=Nocardioides sp. TaxID=35761 RepID=UPI00286BA316|nr:DUF6758 family protein [Nocardioides sp.]
MSLTAGCPRCPTPIAQVDERWSCPEHGDVAPLWRPAEASYDAFADHLRASIGFPTLIPWPVPPAWSVTDFAVVGADPERARATMIACSGASELDGPVDLIILSEEAGVGLGARIAGTHHDDPGSEISSGSPMAKVRIDSQAVPLWAVSTSNASSEWDRSVMAGEASGRWLWLIFHPASAMLLLRDDWILRDLSEVGPQLLELPFGGPAPLW